MRLLLLLFLLTRTALAAPAVEVEGRLVLPEDPLPFGKAAELVLEVRYPAEGFEPPPAGSLELEGATVLDRFSVERAGAGGRKRVDYHLVFTRLEPGEFTVGPVKLAGGVESEPLTMNFAGSTPKEGDQPGEIRGPKPVVELSTADFWTRLAKWGGLSLLLLALLAFLIGRLGLLDRLLSPRSRALRRLKRLKGRGLGPEETVLQLVEVLRDYLADAYSLTTREATAREILRQMTLDNRCTSLKPVAEEVLGRGDRVKFASESLSRPEASDHYQNLIAALRAERKARR